MSKRELLNETGRHSSFDSAAYRKGVPAESILPFRTAAEIATHAPEEVPWIARPWTAVGTITEVMGKPKQAGKTTWVQRLVGCVLDGVAFLSEPTSKTPVVYLTEERESTFREALRRAGLLERSDLHVLQWHDTLGASWESIMESAVAKCDQVGARLLVVDTVLQFAQLAGDRENNSGDVLLEVYGPMQEAAARGLGVMSIRHERKSGGDVANAGRGSSAFAGAADIVLAIRSPEGNVRPTIREIHALSRFDDTPDFLAIELTEEGYVRLGDSAAVAATEAKTALLRVAPTSEHDAQPLDLLAGRASIKRTTAQEAAKELLTEGALKQVGKGVKGDPHRLYAPQIRSAETPTPMAAEALGSASAKAAATEPRLEAAHYRRPGLSDREQRTPA